jgi:hypothetical protein
VKNITRLFAITITTAAAATNLFADNAGTTGANVLNIPVSARAIAMGDAYTAMADNTGSLYWNPAGLSFLNQSEASFMYSQWLKDFTYQHAAVATPLEHGGIGASVSYLSYGHIDGFNDVGDPTGSVNAYSGVGTIGGGVFGEAWAAGLNLKGVQTSLADVKATALAADLGASLVYPKEVMGGTLRAAATFRNLGTGMKFIDRRDPLPQQWRVGISALELVGRRLNLSMDYGQERDLKGAFYAGSEFWLVPALALRAGYSGASTEGNGLRAGVGLRIKDVGFDYAFASYGDLGITHRYELNFRFGAVRPRLSAEQRAMLRRAKLAMADQRYGEAVQLLDALIQTEPRYPLFHRLAKSAMHDLEKQENMAKTTIRNPVFVERKSKRNDDLDEVKELEMLLKLGDERQAMKNTTGGSK